MRRTSMIGPLVVGMLLLAGVSSVAAEDPRANPEPSSPSPQAESSAGEDPVGVTTRIQPDPSYVGDVLRYEVVAAYPRGYSVNLPSGLTMAPLHLVDVEEGSPEATGEGLRKTFVLRLQHFEPGPARVPGFPLTYVTPDGEVQTVEIPAADFTVDALLANESDPQRKPEDPPISLTYPNTLAETIIYSAGGTLLAVALLLPFALHWWRRERVVPPPPPVPPHEKAHAALEALESGTLLDEGRFQAFYLQLTEVAKDYLEERFGVPALDHTTEEIRRALVRQPERIAPLKADDVVRFLQRCDLVKFARFEPPREEAGVALHEVKDMVERTTSRPTDTAKQVEAS